MTSTQMVSSVVGYCVYNNGNCAPMVGLTTRNLKPEVAETVVYQVEKLRLADLGLRNIFW